MKLVLALLTIIPFTVAAPAGAPEKRAAPTVLISAPAATIVGSTSSSVDTFNGIPFAQPPVGALRLKPPQPLTSSLGTVNAVDIARACPQMFFTADADEFPSGVLGTILDSPLFQTVTKQGEDCLSVNVQRPAGTTASSKLPVLFWIYGGGFQLGSTSTYDGTSLVRSSVSLGKPVILVAVNYRVGGFGFMPGKEILADGSANLGHLDQRLALKWVADNIAAFGGDPTKVTIWGESAGAISVLNQMVMYDGDINYKGKPLFRAGIMNSGSIIPADPVDCPKGQKVYDMVVANAGCAGAGSSLDCLRGKDYSTFLAAANSVPGVFSYTSVALSYMPRPDGVAITTSPEVLISQGKYAKVPFIIGDQEDEGTIFALFQKNITTTTQVVDYLSKNLFQNAPRSVVAGLVATYQNIVTDGSPFRTLGLNNWYPQFMRMAAILGDASFTLTRRSFLSLTSSVSPSVPSWSYLASYDYGTPILGTFHASDIIQVFYGILPNYSSESIRSYYFSFVHNLDPNVGSGFKNWPKWSTGKKLMNFYALDAVLINDDFRADTSAFIDANIPALYV